MRIDDKIKILCIKNDITLSELATRLNQSPQAFSQKVKRGRFTLDDLDMIALVTGSVLNCNIELPNGEKLQLVGKEEL